MKRINDESAPALIRDIFFRILFYARKKFSTLYPSLLKALGKFASVKIQDSTVMQLNVKLLNTKGP